MNIRTLTLGALDTNCHIVWDDHRKGCVIDPADETEKILAFIDEEQLTIESVVLTHTHFDHMMSAAELCLATDAPLYVGMLDEPALSDPVRNLSGVFQMCAPLRLSADKTLREGDVLRVGELSFTVMETPGHTPGCICLFRDGVLFSGDTLFRDSIGRVDFPGGDVPKMLASLRRLAALPPETVVYSGHGATTTIGREVEHNPYMLRI